MGYGTMVVQTSNFKDRTTGVYITDSNNTEQYKHWKNRIKWRKYDDKFNQNSKIKAKTKNTICLPVKAKEVLYPLVLCCRSEKSKKKKVRARGPMIGLHRPERLVAAVEPTWQPERASRVATGAERVRATRLGLGFFASSGSSKQEIEKQREFDCPVKYDFLILRIF